MRAYRLHQRPADIVGKKKEILTGVAAYHNFVPDSVLYIGFNPVILAESAKNISVSYISEEARSFLTENNINFNYIDPKDLHKYNKKFEVVIALDTSGTSAASVREFAQPIEQVVQAAAAAIQDFILSMGANLTVRVDQTTGYHVIQVTDSGGNVVMHLPSEAAVRIAHNMESLKGLFVNNVA
jgi:uncharacterized FlaG/YvyC family protein